ncbi:MAG: AAA family ATPase [Bacteroidota bacterium]
MKTNKNQILTSNLINSCEYDLVVKKETYYSLFYHLTGEFPFEISYSNINFDEISKVIFGKYPHVKGEEITNRFYNNKTNVWEIVYGLIPITDNIFVILDESEVTIYYNQNSDLQILEDLKQLIESNVVIEVSGRKFHLLIMENDRFSLKSYELKDYNLDINTHYNQDFASHHEKICSSLSKENGKGLVLLYGEPGSGKSTYIKYLTSIIDKTFIYIPSEFAEQLASPGFVHFIMGFPGSILILEDAERVLCNSNKYAKTVVSNLLNITDGIIGNILNVKLLCTLNSNISSIDPAFMRPGRLLAKYCFGKLSVERSNNLLNSLGHSHKTEKELLLSDIYNLENTINLEQEKSIGYKI